MFSPAAFPPFPAFPPVMVPPLMTTSLSVLIPEPPFPPLPGVPVAESEPLPPFPPETEPPFTVVPMVPSIPEPPFPPLLPFSPSAPLPPLMTAFAPTVILPACNGLLPAASPTPAAPSGCAADPLPPWIVPFTISRFVPGCSVAVSSFLNTSPGFASLEASALFPVMVCPPRSIFTFSQVSGISTLWLISFLTITL